MISFKYYKSYGIEYCLGKATVQGFMGRPLKTFTGGCIKAVEKAEKYIDSLNCA
jgi:hypothetical protein